MSETTIGACPVCGGVARRPDLYPVCQSCGLCAPVAAWQHLSRAAALLRACEVFQRQKARIHTYYHNEDKAWGAYDPLSEGPDARADSPAAAIIALAQQIGAPHAE